MSQNLFSLIFVGMPRGNQAAVCLAALITQQQYSRLSIFIRQPEALYLVTVRGTIEESFLAIYRPYINAASFHLSRQGGHFLL